MADLPAPAPKPDLSQIPNGALNGAAAQLAAQSGPRFVLPHMQQFQAVWKTPAGTYRFSFDEALKRSHTDALAMRRDGHLIHLLQARYLPVLGADWHIKADDEQDEERAKTYQALLEKTPRFLQLRKCLLEAVWFGRYGVQLAFGTIEVNGRQMQGITAWRPVNGDKINFREDGTPTVRINPAFAARLRDDGATIEDAEKHPHTAWNDQGTVLVLDQPRYRQRFAIHVHEVEDADFSEPELAGGVGGVGLRHYCYWVWWLRQEVMEWLLNYLEMMGAGGLTIVGYDAGNPKGLDLAQQAFEERATVVYLPIPPGQEKQTNLVQRIEPSGTGNDIFHGWIDGYFNAILTRLIIGQDLSSQSSGTGLGSGVADLQADVKQCIHRYDARNLNETETQQLLNVLIALNEPSGNTNLRCETVLKDKDPEKALQAAKQAFDMGAELPESFVVKTAGIPEPKKGERLLSQAQQQQQQEALTSAVAGGHASAAGIGLGEMRNYLDAQGIPEEEQLHHLADMVDGGELQEIDTDDGVKYVEAGQYQDTPPSQDQPKTYAKEDWIEETGPRGGKRWTNRKSGTVQYKEPGEGRTGPKDAQIEEPAQEGDKPVAKLRKGMVAQGAYQYADKALRGESNKTLEGEGVLAHVVNLDKRLVKSQVVSLAAQHGMPVSASTTKTRALAFIEDKLRGHLDAHLKQQKGGKAGKERVDSEEAGGAASPAVGANQAQGTMPAASPALPGQATPAPTAEGEYPASAPPGSEERIRLMAERAAQKKPLFGQEEKPNVVQTNAGGFPEAAPARDGTPEVLGQGGSGGGEHPGERAVLEDGAGGGTEAGQEQGQEEGHLPPRQDETLNQYCKRAGIQEAYPHVKAHALQLHQLQREQVDKHNDIVRTAMKALKKESGLVTSRLVAQRGKDGNVDTAKGERAKDDLTKWNKLWSKAKDGGDYASLPGFDQITREIASEHTDLFKGAYRTEGGDDSTGTALDDQEKLFGMLVEGVRPVPDFREAEDQALQDYEESRANHRRATGESADNAESGDTSFEPEFMGEDEAREHLAEHLTPEEMPGTMEAAQENQDAILQGDAPDSGAAEHDRADEGGAQPRQGEEDRASPGEGEREGQGQSPYAQKVDELPPIPEGHGRLTHVTTKQGVDQILKGGLDYSRQGIDATTDIHNGNESIHDLAKTGNVAGTGFNRNKFGDQVVLSDLSEDEYRKHADLTGGAPGSIHPSRIVGHIDRTTGKFTPNPQYNPNAQVDVGSSAPEPMPVGPRARRPGSGGTAPISGAESVPVPVPSGKAEVWGDEEAPPASDFMQQEQKSGPHTPESVAESAGQSFTNDKGLTVDVRKNADGTWNVGSLTNVSRAAVANYLNSHGAMRAPGLFKDDVTAQRGHDYDENEAVAKERERAHTMALGDMDPEWFHGAESWAVQGSQLKVKKELDGTYTVTSHNPKYPSLGEQHISKGLPRDMTMNNIWRGRFVPSQGTGEFDRLVDKGIRSLRARAKRPEWAAQTKPQGGPELPGMKDAFAPGMFGEAKTEEEAKPTEPKTTHPLGHYSRTTEDGTSVEPLREGERPISQTIRVQHAKGYRGKLGNTSYVAKINGTSSRYGLEREFQKADRMDWGDSKLFKKNKGVYHAEHDVPPQGGVYEVNEHGEKRFGVHVPLKWNGKSKLMEYRVGEEGLKTAYQMLERAGRKPSELVTAFVHTADQKAMKTPERVKKYLEDLEAQEPAASPNLAEIQHEPSSAPARPESPASPAATPGPAGEEATPQTESAAGEPAKADAYDRLHQKLGMPDTAFPSLRSMASATSTKQLPTYATPDAAREHVSHAYSTAPAHSPDDAKAHWERMAGLERLGKNDLADVAKAANVHIPPGTTREIAANLIRNAYARRRGASLRAEMTAPGAKGAIGQLPLLPERAEAAVKPAGNLDPVKMDVMSKPELLGHAEKMELYGLGKKSRQEIAAAIRAKLGE